MKNRWTLLAILALVFFSCNNETEKEDPSGEGGFFPTQSFIKSQIANIDTSLYSITKIVELDSTHSDTTPIRREDFRALTADFLELPDLTEKKYKKRYREEKMFDEMMNRVILAYLPNDPEKELIQRQELLIAPDPSGDKITSIIIDISMHSKDSSVQKKLLWQADRNFQVITIRQLPGQPEKTTKLKVIWSDEPVDTEVIDTETKKDSISTKTTDQQKRRGH